MDFSGLRVGMTGDAALVVDETKTALALGSGSALVLGTPALIILMEMAALQCVEALLPAGAVSLGTVVNVEHVAPSPLGACVTARAELTAIDHRLLSFAVIAHEGDKLVGHGSHKRAVVDLERFMKKLGPQSAASPAK